jgi:hypothetical protein
MTETTTRRRAVPKAKAEPLPRVVITAVRGVAPRQGAIKAAIAATGESTTAICRAHGLNPSQMRRPANDEVATVDLLRAEAIAEALGKEVGDLFGGVMRTKAKAASDAADTAMMAVDPDGARYRRVQYVKCAGGPAEAVVEAFRKPAHLPGVSGAVNWLWAVYSVRPADDPDAAPVAMEWHGVNKAWYVGPVGYRLMRDAAAAALAVARARTGRLA